jgi:mono/diheme cytochrome c family protein
MASKHTTMVAVAILVWVAAVAFSGETRGFAEARPSDRSTDLAIHRSTELPMYRSTEPPSQDQKTTNDGVYTKAQADGAKAQFDKICAECHPFTVAARKKPKDVPLGDEPFFENWEGRSLDAIITTIVLTMPNDGSGVVTDAEAVDLVAYILQQNGFPAGETALTKDSAAVVARPKK